MRYGLIGEKLGHSFSKQLHEMICDMEYDLLEIPRDEIEAWFSKADFEGVNVTIPYKEIALKYCIPDEKAKAIGSVNTLVKRDGKVYGYNTDADGFGYMLRQANISLAGKKVVILGSGGTAKTAVYVADKEMADEIIMLSRNPGGCEALAAKYPRLKVVSYENAGEYLDAQVIINTTPVGMYPNIMNSPIDISGFEGLEGVADVIYNPLKTVFCSNAAKAGIAVTGGLPMLVVQAFEAEKIWGRDITALPQDVTATLAKERSNIVLVGMPGSGKSTVGRLLGEQLKRPFFDTDEEFGKEFGITPGDSIINEGEATMREKEKQIVRRISGEMGAVIATGGGVVLADENIGRLSSCGTIIFLDRDIEKLEMKGRPLSKERGLQKIYDERIDKYRACADYTVSVSDDAQETIEAILSFL